MYIFNDYGDEAEMFDRTEKFKRKIENDKALSMTEAELLTICIKAQPCFRLDVDGINRCHIKELYLIINFLKSHVKAIKIVKNELMKKRSKAMAGSLPRYMIFDSMYARRVIECLRNYAERCEITLNRWFSYVKEADTEKSTTLALQDVASESDKTRIRDGTLVRMTVQDPETYGIRSFLLSRQGFVVKTRIFEVDGRELCLLL